MRSGHSLELLHCGKAFKVVQRVPPFVYSIFNVRYKTGRDYSVPFEFLFGTMLLFSNFFCRQMVPFKFFDILKQTEVSKSTKGPPFTILKTLRFLSLRYSADYRRPRLVSFFLKKKHFFDFFRQMSQSAEKYKRVDPLGFINIHSVAKYQKTRWGILWRH